MNIECRKKVQHWGDIDLALFGVNRDWYGEKLECDIGFSFIIDPQYFWFVATHEKPSIIHPNSNPNQFTPQLWKYDLAEFFISNFETGAYLEFNLAPNGAWWAADFVGPREGMVEAPMDGVKTYHDYNVDGPWLAAARIELGQLKNRFPLDRSCRINASFIVNTPDQKFVSVADLGSGEPDFHRPDRFEPLQFIDEAD